MDLGESGEEHLADDVDMRGKRWLKHDGYVRIVEELDSV